MSYLRLNLSYIFMPSPTSRSINPSILVFVVILLANHHSLFVSEYARAVADV